jgi:uncharacterized protein (TIGR01615 family)
MLFDLELEDQESGDDVAVPSISRQLLKLLQPRSPEEHQLGLAVNAAYEKAAAGGRQLGIDELADTLRGQGHDVRIRTALGGGGGGECLRNLRHQFLTLNMTGQDGVRVECIIDPSFAEQWGIARPTPAYAHMVAALPQVYVGAAIEPLVDFLCSELAAAFRAEGATLPPWRAADAMLSKWRPRRSVDCDMLAPNGSYRAPHSPFDAAMAHLSRRSAGSSRPSKSQRLSGVAGGGGGAVHKPAHHGSASLHASPRASPKPSPRGSFLPGSSYMGGRPLAMDKSASRALSDAEAEEAADAQAAIAAVAKAAAAEFALDGYADVYANGGDVSDSSNDSDAATTTDLHLRGGGSISQGRFGGQSGSYRVGRRASANTDLSTLSSSWRASDCMPFGGGGGGGNVAAASSPHRSSVYGGAVRMSLEGVSTSDGSDTTQTPAAPPLALQGRLTSAPPRLPGPAAGSTSQAPPQPAQLTRIPSAPQPPAPTIEPDFDFPKPVPAKSALTLARRSAGGSGGGVLDRKSGTLSRSSGGTVSRVSGGSRAPGGRTVKCLPPLEAGPGRQTSFPFAASKAAVLSEMHAMHGGGKLGSAHSISAGELSKKVAAAVASDTPQGGPSGLPPLQGGPSPAPGTSPARRAAAVRQQFGLPAGRRVEEARRSLFATAPKPEA